MNIRDQSAASPPILQILNQNKYVPCNFMETGALEIDIIDDVRIIKAHPKLLTELFIDLITSYNIDAKPFYQLLTQWGCIDELERLAVALFNRSMATVYKEAEVKINNRMEGFKNHLNANYLQLLWCAKESDKPVLIQFLPTMKGVGL